MSVPITSNWREAARQWLERHPILAVALAICSFFFIFLPQWGASVWQLFSDKPFFVWLPEKMKTTQLSFSPNWITAPVGLLAILFIVYLLATGRRKVEAHESQTDEAATAKLCPDKWLHEIAESHRKSIDKYVRLLKCEIGRHDLVKGLYVEFKFTILNVSVYDIEIEDSVKGDIYFDSYDPPLFKEPKMDKKDSTRYYRHGESGSFRICQGLYENEIKNILVASDDAEFRLKGLEIKIKGGSSKSEVIPKQLEVYGLRVLSKELKELYQELRIEIQQATFTAYWNFEHGTQKEDMTIPAFYGFLINMRVRIVNPRLTQVKLRGCRLTVKIKGKEYASDAETGEVIYQNRIISKGEQILRGEKFENLNPTHPHPRIIEAKDEYTGHLQFILRDAPQFGDDEEKGPVSATLSISDASGEIHHAEGQLSYVTSYKL